MFDVNFVCDVPAIPSTSNAIHNLNTGISCNSNNICGGMSGSGVEVIGLIWVVTIISIELKIRISIANNQHSIIIPKSNSSNSPITFIDGLFLLVITCVLVFSVYDNFPVLITYTHMQAGLVHCHRGDDAIGWDGLF